MMRAIHIALLILCIQIGIGIVAESGIFSGYQYYENRITGYNISSNAVQTDAEQIQASISGMQSIWNILTWGWITTFFEPLYSNDTAVRAFIDHILLFLRSITAFMVTVAFIEFVRNRINILG